MRLLQDKQKRGAEIRSLKEALVVKQQEFEKMQVSIKEQQEVRFMYLVIDCVLIYCLCVDFLNFIFVLNKKTINKI